jgi:AraC-like DNA-binding protein
MKELIERETISRDLNHQRIQMELAAYLGRLRQTSPGDSLPKPVQQALVFIHNNLFDETLDAASVRVNCGLNNNNISSWFKRHVGLGMRRYIEVRRMEAAQGLLRHADLTVLQIAWSVGYAYPESFARAFKRHTGQSATDFRVEVLRQHVKTIC